MRIFRHQGGESDNGGTLKKVPVPGLPGMYTIEMEITDEKREAARRRVDALIRKNLPEQEVRIIEQITRLNANLSRKTEDKKAGTG